jgi:hypothetical protein
MTNSAENLPRTLGAWTRSDSAEIIDESNIFDYMNGAGELYLAYRFDHLDVYEYTSEQQDDILVEVYVMHTSDDAFGLLSLDWGGEPATFSPSDARRPEIRLCFRPERCMAKDYCDCGQIESMRVC